jgi:hypothetical protein
MTSTCILSYMHRFFRNPWFYTIGLVLIAAAWGVYLFTTASKTRSDPMVACTADALLCPDGSGVGRSGPDCTFAPCPDQGSFTGELVQQGEQFVLSIPSLQNVGTGVTYALPLLLTDAHDARSLLGRIVTVTGTFTAGTTLSVATLVPAAGQPSEAGVAQGTLAVGGSRLIGAVRVTLEEIVADSRCAVDVQCIQAGAARMRVTLTSDTDQQTITMSSDEGPHPFDSYTVSISDVSPAPVSTLPLTVSDYRVTFTVAPLTPAGTFEQ